MAELASTGSAETSRFHALSAGNTWQLPSGPFWAHVPPLGGAVVVLVVVVLVVVVLEVVLAAV